MTAESNATSPASGGRARPVRSPSEAPGSQPGAPRRHHASWFWVALLGSSALLYLVLAARAARLETPTVDEFAHLPAGAAYWRHGDFDLFSKNPPLLKLWMSIPVAADRGVSVPVARRHDPAWGAWDYGTLFMNANRPRYLSLFFRARLMIILVGLLTAGLLVHWARRLYSLPAAAILGSLFLLSPTVLAHAHLATIDMGCAFTVLLSLWALRQALLREDAGSRALTIRRMGLAGGALGLALAVKYTALLLLPVEVFLIVLRRAGGSGRKVAGEAPARSARGRRRAENGRAGARGVRGWIQPTLRDAGILLCASLLVVNAAGGFAGSFRSLGSYRFVSSFGQDLQQDPPGWLPVPVPSAYITGFDALKQDAEKGEFGSYLLGRWSSTGWWYYNFFALLVKESEPFLLLLLLAPFYFRRFWKGRANRWESWFLLVPAAVLFLSLSLFNRLDLGIRYVLPVFPLLYLLAGPVLEGLALRAGSWRAGLAAGVVVGYCAATAIVSSPDHLAWFNLISGGPRNGAGLLIDSNLDWGQDLYRVPALESRLRPGEKLGLLYFGHVDPAIYGIDYDPVPPAPTKGLLAVSVNFLRGYRYYTPVPGGKLGLVEPDHLKWLRARKPIARLGSIWVFDTR